MLRVLLTIVVPLILPTAVYVLWIRTAGREDHGGTVRWRALPWLWLAGAGAALLAFVLLVVTVHFGTSQPGVYVPPRYEGGHLVPPHIDPKPPQ
jgi:hypothetical protein